MPSGVIIGGVTVGLWVMINPGAKASDVDFMRASTAVFAALIVMAVWVLAMVARPWNRWRALLVAGCAGAYCFVFFFPPVARLVKLDTSDTGLMLSGLGAGVVGIALIELVRVLGRSALVCSVRQAVSTRWNG